MRMIRISDDPDEDPAELVDAEYALLKPAPYGWTAECSTTRSSLARLLSTSCQGGDPTKVDVGDTFHWALAVLARDDDEPD